MRLEYGEIIYKTYSVQVQIAVDLDTHTTVCAKQYLLNTKQEQKVFGNEIASLYRLNTHPNVLKILGHQRTQKDGRFLLEMVLEYCSKGDLCTELNKRANEGRPWTDKEIIDIMAKLIHTFEFLQREGIAHRDIKPDNILVTDDYDLKVTDLGASSAMSWINNEQTIVGTSYYMSPELRNGYLKPDRDTSLGRYTQYNAFKSDVWSLGLTFLTIIFLRSVEDFSNLENVEATAASRINEISNPTIKNIIQCMLVVDPNLRKDFIELSMFLEESKKISSFCIICQQTEGDTIWCENCFVYFHPFCISQNTFFQCPGCKLNFDGTKFFFHCAKCNKVSSIQVVQNCNHLYCESCVARNIECAVCFGLVLVREIPRGKVLVYDKVHCQKCNKRMIREKKSLHCVDCEVRLCRICKNQEHQSHCWLGLTGYEVQCRCRLWVKKATKGIFLQCDLCGFLCIVCYGRPESSHVSCAGKLKCIAKSSE